MRVIHVVESFAGGVYDFIKNLTSILDHIDHTVIYGIRSNTPTQKQIIEDFSSSVELVQWSSASRELSLFKDTKAFLELYLLIKRLRTKRTILHLHSSKAGFLGRVVGRILNLQDKVLYTSHGASFLRKDVSVLKRKMFIFLEKLAYNFGGTLVACSKSEAEVFKRYGMNAIYIYNGVNCKEFLFSKETDTYGRKKSKIIIGTVGRITYAKNPELFNRIAQEFIDEQVEFLWIGDGELSGELDSPNITITGWLDKEQLVSYLKDVDIYLSTSLWEGLPLSVLQAMCLRKPLVLSRCIGNVDLISDNGFLFNTKDEAVRSLRELIKNEHKRKSMGYNSYKLVRNKFSLEKMAEAYLWLYERLLR